MALEQAIEEQAGFHRQVEQLKVLPGFGLVCAWTVVAEIGDITRRSGKHVARTVVSKELAKIVWHMLAREEEYKGFKGRMTRVTTQNYWPQPISPGA